MNTSVIRIFGISNCDTMKKARKWLTEHEREYEFHDYKKHGIDEATLTHWCESLGWETLLNRRGTTWRKLDDNDKQDLSQGRAIELMMANTSLIKRPVILRGETLLVGFDEARYQSTFG